MAEPRRVDVEILGQRYAIRSDAPPDYVKQLVSYVEKRVKEIRGDTPGQDSTKLLVLTALGIGDTAFFESTKSLGLARAMTISTAGYPLVAG